ncbi:MAG: DUF1501 domain-containing protein [Bacteroidota bacterium]
MSKRIISRRKFLGEASCAAMGTTTLFSSLLNLGMFNALSKSLNAPSGDYKALVCILLSGGNDSFNMLVPNGAEYGEYALSRSGLALPQNELLPLNPLSPGTSLALHPALQGIQTLFEAGDLAFLSNVGTLVQPTTKAQVVAGSVPLPLGLLSHSDQAMQWQTSVPQERSATGWGGKMADIIGSMNTSQDISMNISLSGNNVFQSGEQTVEYTINPNDGAVSIQGYDDSDPFHQLMTSGVNSLLNQQYQDVFKTTYANVIKNSIQSNANFNEALEQVGAFNTTFSDNYVSQSLRMIARTIAAREALGMKRQTFFLNFGGWDHHDELLDQHAEGLGILSTALSEFYSALDEISMNDCVTTFSVSDFARTLTSNGNGTDHGWGGNAFIMGGAVKGKEVYGTYPNLALGSDLELGDGILLPTTSADEYFAELALWFGVSPFDLPLILPNIGNFYSVGSGTNPIGFMEL